MSCDVTYEELAALAAGELAPGREAQVLAHLPGCDRCRRRLAALRGADGVLAALCPPGPPAEAVLAARRAFAGVVRRTRAREIMTLEEVAEFLRLSLDQLDEVAEERPAFELAGQVRVRRAALVQWIERRERDYSRQRAGSWAAWGTSQTAQTGEW